MFKQYLAFRLNKKKSQFQISEITFLKSLKKFLTLDGWLSKFKINNLLNNYVIINLIAYSFLIGYFMMKFDSFKTSCVLSSFYT